MSATPIILTVKNFGPIKEIRIEFNKYTILIGEQGSGKSTVAKLFSMFLWLEKSLLRHLTTKKYITQFSRFQKKYCAYHNIDSYFRSDSYIYFEGIHYDFTYSEEQFMIHEKDIENDFHVAKVMYVPAERNYLSTTDNISNLKGLPQSLQSFSEEFEKSKVAIKEGYNLPFNRIQFEYDSLNKISWIKGDDYKVRLSAASSGYQSVLPLVLVSKYLTQLVSANLSQKEIDPQEKKQLELEIEKIMNDSLLTEDVKYAMARNVSSRFSYSHFVNIVEEPEQNLYPNSQMKVLWELLDHANETTGNQLLLTTHSPYLINYISLAIKGWQISQYTTDRNIQEKIYSIIPEKSLINPANLKIYELENGLCNLLNSLDGIPSDANFLNEALGETNILFDALLEIEEEIEESN